MCISCRKTLIRILSRKVELLMVDGGHAVFDLLVLISAKDEQNISYELN